MKKFVICMITLCLLFSVSGCAKLVSTEYENVEVVITDEYYRSVWVQPISTGKSTTLITHPARYEITVEYNGVEYTLDDSDTYNKYKEKVGQIIIGTLEICTYDDGTIKYDIVALE